MSGECRLVVRPESLKIASSSGARDATRLAGTVRDATFLGQHWELVVDVEGLREPLLVSVTTEGSLLDHAPGQRVEVLPNWEHVTFSTADGKRMSGGA